jgi:hypothetical protein
MSRPIKFRAWDGEKMIYPDGEKYVIRFDGVIGCFNGETYDTVDWPIMQMIDWKDIYGNQLWEGDIITYDLEKAFGNPKRHNLRRSIKIYSTGAIGAWDTNIRKIGNIYENPTLISL